MRYTRRGVKGAPEIAHPPSTTPSKAGGRWPTLGGWPKWRSAVLKNAAVDAFYLPGIKRFPESRIRHRPPHQRRVVDDPLLVGGRNGDRSFQKTGRSVRFTYRGSQGSPKSRIRHRPPHQRRVVGDPLLVGGRNGDRPFQKTRRSMRFTYLGSGGSRNRASAIDRRIKGGRPMTHSWWVAKMAIGRFRKTGRSVRCTYRGSQGSPKSRNRHRPPHQRRVADDPLLAGG